MMESGIWEAWTKSSPQELTTTLLGLFITVGIGILLGLEREYSHIENRSAEGPKETFAGIRTFPIISLAGFLSLFLANAFSPWIFIAGLAGTIVLVAISYYVDASHGLKGSTTQFSAILVFLLGGLVFLQYYLVAITIAVVVTLLMALKPPLHTAIGKFSRKEIYAIIEFVIIAALVLPFLPNQTYGPYDALNPREIWLIIVLLVSINFIGYLLAKFIKQRKSILITGLFGGLASSTAVAWYFSRQSYKARTGEENFAGGILIASSLMFPRILIWLYILNQELLMEMFLPILLLGALGVGFSILIIKKFKSKESDDQEDITQQIRNPLNLKDALKFGVIYVVILLLVGFTKENFGNQGVYAVSGISGLTDVDAITISMANLGGQKLTHFVSGNAIIIGALANTLVKYLLGLIFGNKRLKKLVTIGFLPLFGAGVIYLVGKMVIG